MKLIIEDDEGRKTVVPFVRDEITIGRQEGNTIRLTERNVSRRHARLVKDDGVVTLEDVGSSYGVRVNGERIQVRRPVKEGDLIEIGDYDLSLEGAPAALEEDTNPSVTPQAGTGLDREKTPPMATPAPRPSAPAPAAPAVAAPPPATPRPAPPSPAPSRPVTQAPGPAPRKPADVNATAVIRLSEIPGMEEAQNRDLAPQETPRLVGLAGALRGRELPLRRAVVKFGRIPDGNDLVIDHPSISRSHGRFQFDGAAWKVFDDRSANGIRINGDEYGMSPVKPGDTIELGHVKFRFCAPGEAFVPPREGAPARQPLEPEMMPAPKSMLPLVLGIAGAVVVLGVVGAVFALKGAGPEDSSSAEVCARGKSAFINENWGEAVKQLSIARDLRVDCGDLEAMLEKSRLEADAKASLDEAEGLLLDGKFRQALALLKDVPAESAYAAEAKLRSAEARTRAVKQLAEQAERDIDRGRVDDAKATIDDIEALEKDNPTIPLLRARLATAAARQPRPASTAPVPAAAPAVAEKIEKSERQEKAEPAQIARATPPSAPAQPTINERNAAARSKIQEANKLITSQDYRSAVTLLNQALDEKPGTALVAATYRSLGVSYARMGQMDEAAKYYELYLKAKPDAPERKQLEEMLRKYYESKGG